MADGSQSLSTSSRNLSTHYRAWRRRDEESFIRAIRSALIVLDANVLLSLYEVGATARAEILSALTLVTPRLWVPHQAVIEYSRNRTRVVEDRVKRFSRVRRVVRSGEKQAVDAILGAVAEVVALRERNRTSRDWDPGDHGLDRQFLTERLHGVLEAALNELDALEAEHDLRPEDMTGDDAVYAQIDTLISGRIGGPPSSERFRELVQTAVTFRFPNAIPPGYEDEGKRTGAAAAGDYLLWAAVLERAAEHLSPPDVLLLTGDTKADWWEINDKKRVIGPRPELVQEMFDETGRHLYIQTLAEFLSSAQEHLQATVSAETLEQVRDAQRRSSVRTMDWFVAMQEADFVSIHEISPMRLHDLVGCLLDEMGYAATTSSYGQGHDFDFVVGSPNTSPVEDIAVEIKMFRFRMPSDVINRVFARMQDAGITRGIIVTTGLPSRESVTLAKERRIEIINGPELARLLSVHFGITTDSRDWEA